MGEVIPNLDVFWGALVTLFGTFRTVGTTSEHIGTLFGTSSNCAHERGGAEGTDQKSVNLRITPS